MNSITLTVLLGTTMLGAIAGVVGTWAVLRRRALTGDLISHAALPGLCAAFWLVGERDYTRMLLGALLSGLLSVALVTFLIRKTRTKEDAAIGIVLSTSFALGIVFLSLIQRSERLADQAAGLASFSLGQAANLGRGDLAWIGGVGGLAILTILVCYKEFKVFSFDPVFAAALGLPVLALDLAMMGCLVAVAVVGIKAVGGGLSPALLILPAATARFWSDRLGRMLLLAAICGGMAGAIGTLLSAGGWSAAVWPSWAERLDNLPTGPMIVLVGTCGFVFSLLCAPRRGLITQWQTQSRLQKRIARENFLRGIFESLEAASSPPDLRLLSAQELNHGGVLSPQALQAQLRQACAAGDLEQSGTGYRLTARGLERARAITRAHRLWELFLIQGANIATDHVDRDADSIEHLLPPNLLDALEAELRAAGRWPEEPARVAASPHERSDGSGFSRGKGEPQPGSASAIPTSGSKEIAIASTAALPNSRSEVP
jgi:manganese/zinc/iron transport system permease protein